MDLHDFDFDSASIHTPTEEVIPQTTAVIPMLLVSIHTSA